MIENQNKAKFEFSINEEECPRLCKEFEHIQKLVDKHSASGEIGSVLCQVYLLSTGCGRQIKIRGRFYAQPEALRINEILTEIRGEGK